MNHRGKTGNKMSEKDGFKFSLNQRSMYENLPSSKISIAPPGLSILFISCEERESLSTTLHAQCYPQQTRNPTEINSLKHDCTMNEMEK